MFASPEPTRAVVLPAAGCLRGPPLHRVLDLMPKLEKPQEPPSDCL